MKAAAELDRNVRVEGNINLLAALHDGGVRRYLLQSSGFWYAPGAGLTDESVPFISSASPEVEASARTYLELEARASATARCEVGLSVRSAECTCYQAWGSTSFIFADSWRSRPLCRNDAAWVASLAGRWIVVTGCGVGSSLPRLLCLGPTQAFAGEFDAPSAVDETVQDGVGVGRIGDDRLAADPQFFGSQNIDLYCKRDNFHGCTAVVVGIRQSLGPRPRRRRHRGAPGRIQRQADNSPFVQRDEASRVQHFDRAADLPFFDPVRQALQALDFAALHEDVADEPVQDKRLGFAGGSTVRDEAPAPEIHEEQIRIGMSPLPGVDLVLKAAFIAAHADFRAVIRNEIIGDVLKVGRVEVWKYVVVRGIGLQLGHAELVRLFDVWTKPVKSQSPSGN